MVTPHNEIGFDDLPPNMRKEFLHYPIGQLGSFKKAVRQFEIDILKKAIEKHGSVHEAAYHLKLDPTTIYRKLKTAESPD